MKDKALTRIILLLMIQPLSQLAPAQNVGINTTAPSAYGHGGTNRLLEIYNNNTGPNSQSHIILSTGAVTEGSIGTLSWTSPALQTIEKRLALVGAGYESGATANTAGTGLFFYTRSSATNQLKESLRISGEGNVGIGNSTPWAPLQFSNSIVNRKIVLYQTTNNDHQYYGFGINGGTLRYQTDASFADHVFYSAVNASSSKELMRIRGNGNVGIGYSNPAVPLSFGPSLGKKIVLYPGSLGDAGFGMSGNRLQIFSDNPNADVAIGYDAAGTFNERFAVKPTGALALTGNQGANGEVVTSGGAGPAYYSRPGYYYQTKQAGNSVSANENGPSVDVPGLTAVINLATPARVVFHLSGNYSGNYCLACENPSATMLLYRNIVGGTELVRSAYSGGLGYAWRSGVLASGPIVVDYPAGSYSFKVMFSNSGYTDVLYLSNAFLTWQIFPN